MTGAPSAASFAARRPVVSALVALAIGCGIALAASELVLRIFNPFGFRVRGDRIVLPSRERYTFESSPAVTGPGPFVHTKNSLGFRGPEVTRPLSSVLSIFAIGGSTTECFYLPDGRTWPELLARRLERRLSPVWVENAGLDGQSTFGHLILLEQNIVALHPRLAIFLVGANDVARDDLGEYDRMLRKGGPDRPRSFESWLAERSEVVSTLVNLKRGFRAGKAGVGHAELDLRSLPEAHVAPSEADALVARHARDYVPGFARRTQLLVDSCRAHAIEPVLVTQPSLFGTAVDDVTGVDLSTRLAAPGLDGGLSWRLLELYNDATREVAKRNQVLLVDVARTLPKSSRFFYDRFHFKDAGSEAIAEILDADLGPYLERRFPELVRGERSAR